MSKITINTDSLKTRREIKRFQIQPGSNIYRILPPFGDESVHNNYPYRKWSLVWMHDPETGRKRPFAIPFVKDVKDPITVYVTLLAATVDRLKKAMEEKQISEDKIREKLAGANKLIYEWRPKHTYFYNAANKAGEVGILELKSTAHKAMKLEMFEYIKDYSQDPTSLSSDPDDSGVWFNVIREGEKGDKDTEYKVKKNQTKQKNEQGRLVWVDDQESLSDHIMENFDKLAYDLHSLYKERTYEDLKDILMFNIANVVDDVPLAKLPGYDPAEYGIDLKKEEVQEEETEVEVEVEEPEEVKPVVVKAKKPVKLAIEDGSDEEPVLAPVAPAKKPAPKKATAVDEDVFARADSILNG